MTYVKKFLIFINHFSYYVDQKNHLIISFYFWRKKIKKRMCLPV